MTTPISICQGALTRMGEAPLSSFTDGSAAALIAQANYEMVKAAVLALYPWRCAMETKRLNKLTALPFHPWEAAWQRPADAIKVWNVREPGNGRAVEFDQQGKKILTLAADDLIVDYGFNCDEAFLEPHVVEMVTLKMAAVFATGIADRASMAGGFVAEFEAYFARAKSADSQGRTPQAIQASRWTSAR